MKRTWQILVLVVLVAGAVPGTKLFAQHQQHHAPAPTAEPQKPAAPEMCPMATMMEHREGMGKLFSDLVGSFDKVLNSQDSQQRQAAMEEHARLLTETRNAFEQHHTAMGEQMMKMCPMMQTSAMHGKDPQEKK